MSKTLAELEASVQARIDTDNDFQASIAELPDEEKTVKVSERRQEEIDKELASLREKAEKAEKAEELAKNQKIRAEKAEQELKKVKPDQPADSPMTPKDYLALTENKISSEDFDEVSNFAKYRGVSVSEALKDVTMKKILEVRAEQRQSAAAAQTKSNRGTSATAPDAVLEKAEKGEAVPESDIDKLADARMARRLKQAERK